MIQQFHFLEKLDKYIQQKSVCVCVCVCMFTPMDMNTLSLIMYYSPKQEKT